MCRIVAQHETDQNGLNFDGGTCANFNIREGRKKEKKEEERGEDGRERREEGGGN